MPKSATLRARLDPALKQEAEAVLDLLGLNATTAITMFYKQIVQQQGLPLSLRVPNKKTREALDDAVEGKGLIRFDDLEQLKETYR
ncbi:MAG: type II toxin-antitoxin system RelB/DinJ family antitoxin [Magnetococcales bacterium]|nr:type II toxin-antitoxin system RelB/DinJ family antitoxin [Magnetococcales bacterium]